MKALGILITVMTVLILAATMTGCAHNPHMLSRMLIGGGTGVIHQTDDIDCQATNNYAGGYKVHCVQ